MVSEALPAPDHSAENNSAAGRMTHRGYTLVAGGERIFISNVEMIRETLAEPDKKGHIIFTIVFLFKKAPSYQVQSIKQGMKDNLVVVAL
jgi:hypothetical protein